MADPSTIPDIPLLGGTSLPQVGFGVFELSGGDETRESVTTALDAGYRSIDTAAIYFNETEVGEAVRGSGLPREDVKVTTKVWNSDQGRDATLAAFDASMERLDLGYVDLYLMHWPLPSKDLYVETWKAMEELLESGRTKAIGVSNFHVPHLERLLAETDVVPAVNQIELSPYLQQPELRAFHAEHGIATEAWSPIARGREVLDDPVVVAIAERHGVTPAQAVLRWHVQLGNILIPRSSNPERIAQNLDLFGFELDQDDLDQIATLERGSRVGPNPDTYDVA